jgi:hypothetical protein
MNGRVAAVLFGVALAAAEGVQAQGSVGASTIPAECNVGLSFGAVQYAGKNDRKDNVSVSWTVSGPQSSCVHIGSFKLHLTVTRRLGHTDSATLSSISGSSRNALVEVPRGVTETDPQSFDVTLDANVSAGGQETSIQTQGNGPPVLAPGGTRIGAGSASCQPSLAFDKLTFFPSSAGKDTVGVFWKASLASPCIKFQKFNVNVRLTRADGRVETQSVDVTDGNVRSTAVDFPVGVTVESYAITVRATTASAISFVSFSAHKAGNF